jgi:hypothetical protein
LILHIGFVERQEHLATPLYRGEILWIDVLLVPDHRSELDVLHRCSHSSYTPVITPAGTTAFQPMVNAIIAPVSDPLLRGGHHHTWLNPVCSSSMGWILAGTQQKHCKEKNGKSRGNPVHDAGN